MEKCPPELFYENGILVTEGKLLSVLKNEQY